MNLIDFTDDTIMKMNRILKRISKREEKGGKKELAKV